MLGFTLWEPWASAMFLLGPDGRPLKQNETRHWMLPHRARSVPIAIHGAKTMHEEGEMCIAAAKLEGYLPDDFQPVLGKIVGILLFRQDQPAEAIVHSLGARERFFGNYEPGRWAWLAHQQRKLPTPIPCRGAQTFWNVPSNIEAEILATLGMP